MNSSFKIAAVVAAAALSFGAQAATLVNPVNGINDSLAFVAVDTTDSASFVADLSFLFTDFAPTSFLVGLGTATADYANIGHTISWNFNTNAVTVDGVAKSGPFNYSSQFSAFAALTGPVKFGVISTYNDGASGNGQAVLATGAANVDTSLQTAGLTSQIQGVVDGLYVNNNGKGTLKSSIAGFGANAVVGVTTAASGYAGNSGNGGAAGTWAGNLAYNSYLAKGSTASFYYQDDQGDGAVKQLGTFTYNAGVLTYTTGAVPEPESIALMLAGLAAVGFVARRRSV